MPKGFQTWTVEISMSDTWVEDGFDLTDERMNAYMCEAMPYITSSEVICKVVKAPNPKIIKKLQGE